MVEPWMMEGSLLGACNCAWGCPCNFDAPPTYGHCQGMYLWIVEEGHYGDTPLDGLKFGWGGHSPGPLHEGHGTAVVVIDDAASPEQRTAVEALTRSGQAGLPFDIFQSVTETWLDTVIAPIEVELAGINSAARVGGGDLYEVRLGRIKNPVTGEEEELYLEKPTGFTSTRTELGSALLERFNLGGLSWESRETYGEYSRFSYSGPG